MGALIAMLVLVGCTASTQAALPAGTCPTADPGRDGGPMIDWVPFIVVGNTMFSTTYSPESELPADRVGEVVTTVRCRIGGAVDDPDFRPRDGDAAYLPAGASVHAVVGEPVSARLAAKEDGVWRLYEADGAETP